MSIVNYENSLPAVSSEFENGCVLGCTVFTCSCTTTFFYWSSTTVDIDAAPACPEAGAIGGVLPTNTFRVSCTYF